MTGPRLDTSPDAVRARWSAMLEQQRVRAQAAREAGEADAYVASAGRADPRRGAHHTRHGARRGPQRSNPGPGDIDWPEPEPGPEAAAEAAAGVVVLDGVEHVLGGLHELGITASPDTTRIIRIWIEAQHATPGVGRPRLLLTDQLGMVRVTVDPPRALELAQPHSTVTLRSYEVCRLSGATYRQLDHWTRRGLLEPSTPAHGSGTGREFPETEAVLAAVLVAYLAIGHGHSQMRADTVQELRSRLHDPDACQQVTLATSDDAVLALTIDLDKARAAVDARLQEQ